MKNKLEQIKQFIQRPLEELEHLLDLMKAEITLIKEPKEQAELVFLAREIRDLLKKGASTINSNLPKCEEHLCRSIANIDKLILRTDTLTVTPSADGHFNVNDPNKFHLYLLSKHNTHTAMRMFIDITSKKTSAKKYFTTFLEQGKELPPGINMYVVAKVNIRRNR